MGNVAFDAGIFGTIGTNYPEGPIFQVLFFKLIIRSLSVFTVCIDPRFPKPCPRAVRLPRSSSARSRIHTRAVMRAAAVN